MLDELFLADIPQDIREQYRRYEQEAKTLRFSLFEDEYIVIDTETTGLQTREHELIEIAAARMRGCEVVDTFQTFIKPKKPISEYIEKLTGISNADVVYAPSAEEAVTEFADYCSGLPMLAHNATFDRSFIEAVKGGKKASEIWIDTLMLSRIALPALSSHKLSDLARAFNCETATHRALDDVMALCGVWSCILVGLSYLPVGLLEKLALMHPEVDWPYRSIFLKAAQSQSQSTFDMKVQRGLLLSSGTTPRIDAAEKLDTLESPSHQEISFAFAEGGLADNMYLNYQYREDQEILAQEVRSAQFTHTHRGIEAGTGVGKTMGYLIPSVLYAQRNGVTVGVATKTNTLTDQLVTRELPLLDSVLPGGVKFFSLKGYSHYPCLKRLMASIGSDVLEMPFDMKFKSKRTVETDILNALAVCAAYVCQSPFGDIDCLGIRWNNVNQSLLTCTSSECDKNDCPFFTRGCVVHSARRCAATSDVVVTNHSLLLRNIETEGAILPPIRNWIVDEAHSFESEARRQWACKVDTVALKSLLNAFRGDRKRVDVVDTLYSRAALYPASGLIAALTQKVAMDIQQAHTQLDAFELAFGDLVKTCKVNTKYRSVSIWINQEIRESEAWESLENIGSDLLLVLEDLLRHMKSLHSELNPVDNEDLRESLLVTFIRDIENTVQALSEILSGKSEEYVYSIDVYKDQNGSNYALNAQYVQIGAQLAERWLNDMLSVVFTSATIEVGGDFSYFNKQVGFAELEEERYQNKKLHSCFDYDRQMSALVVQDMPLQNSPEYHQTVADTLFDIHVAMGGSTLTLFTNKRDMDAIYELLQPRLKKENLKLYKQEPGLGARLAKDNFMTQKSNSLFALKSFWEGFDAQGETLRCVVIVKLPFANPQEPLFQELSIRDRNVWKNYYIPDAVIAVKQAAGRLIRSEADTGILVMLDSRLEDKWYGKTFKKSLPVEPNIISRSTITRFIEMWRKSHEK